MFYRLCFSFALVFAIVACTKVPSSILAASEKGAGEAEAIHGGDLVDLKLRAVRDIYRQAVASLQSARSIETLGAPLHSCSDFPVLSLCEALRAPVAQREEARRFILRNLSVVADLLQSSRLKFIPSNLDQVQLNPDGTSRAVLAWTKWKSDGTTEIYFHQKVRELSDLQLLALMSHEMGHAVIDPILGRLTDNMAIPGFGTAAGDGRYLLDLAAAELTVYAFEVLLKSDPNSLQGTGKGFLAGRNVMKHGGNYHQQATYIDFNGDGKQDLMFVGFNNEVYASTFNGVDFNLPSWVGGFSGTFSPGHFHFVRLNDDRKGDVLYRADDNSITACYSSGSEFTGCHSALQLPGVFADGDLLVGDFNGDAIADIAYRDKNNVVRIYRYDGSIFQSLAEVHLPGDYAGSALSAANITADGDGLIREDLMYHDSHNDFWLYSATGIGFESPRLVMHHGGSASAGIEWYADFNGDGLKDLIFLGGDNRLWLNLSDGRNLRDAMEVGNLGMSGSASRALYTGDFNGDGKADLLFGRSSSGSTHFEALYSGPNGFVQRAAFDLPFMADMGQVQIADADGDGRSDVIIQTLDNAFELRLSLEGR